MRKSNEEYYEEALVYVEERIFVLTSQIARKIKKILFSGWNRNKEYISLFIKFLDTEEGINILKKLNSFLLIEYYWTDEIPYIARSTFKAYLQNFIQD